MRVVIIGQDPYHNDKQVSFSFLIYIHMHDRDYFWSTLAIDMPLFLWMEIFS